MRAGTMVGMTLTPHHARRIAPSPPRPASVRPSITNCRPVAGAWAERGAHGDFPLPRQCRAIRRFPTFAQRRQQQEAYGAEQAQQHRSYRAVASIPVAVLEFEAPLLALLPVFDCDAIATRDDRVQVQLRLVKGEAPLSRATSLPPLPSSSGSHPSVFQSGVIAGTSAASHDHDACAIGEWDGLAEDVLVTAESRASNSRR